jgi:uncharacterized protein (DUF362 family)
MQRREFLRAAPGTAVGLAISAQASARDVFTRERDVSYEPDKPLESTGIRIKEGVKLLKKGRKGNIPPVVREEIMENPDAVFVIYGGIDVDRNEDGSWKPVPDQMKRFGHRVSDLVFRKGTDTGGCTFLKPNMVGSLSENRPVEASHSGIVQPYFTAGMASGLHDIGNTNIGAGARGALRHPQVVASGLEALFDSHGIVFIEAHEQYFKDYRRGELNWHENPEAMIQRRFPTYKPVHEKDTTFVNIAHAHTHKVGHTTLTLKNIQGVMPRGYGHICDAWTTLDLWRWDLMDDFNRDFRQEIEASWKRHANEGYKYWEDGGFERAYFADGGWDAFRPALADVLKQYRKVPVGDRAEQRTKLVKIADTRVFWAEIWAQRMVDIVQALPNPAIHMVEGTFARGSNGTVHADFVTVGRNTVAVDAVTSWLMGQDPRELPYLRIANERGLGQNDIGQIPVYLLDEKGPQLAEYRSLRRERLGIYNYGLDELGLRYY